MESCQQLSGEGASEFSRGGQNPTGTIFRILGLDAGWGVTVEELSSKRLDSQDFICNLPEAEP
jgi:hypothetical protein